MKLTVHLCASPLTGMSHESTKSPPLGMVSTATRTTATVSPLSPLTNGSALAQSSNSGFAAALRKLAKQAEDPRGLALTGESSPVSSPATSHSSPVSTPKQATLGPLLAQSRGHTVVPSTPPVVTIAPTKTSNGLWRAEGRQVEQSVPRLGGGRERASTDNNHPQRDKKTPPVPTPLPLAHPFGLTPSSVMQDPRMQSLSLPGQMHPAVPSGTIPEEYLRALRPFATPDDLRLTCVPLGLDPSAAHAAAAAAAYYHPAFLHHSLSLPRMEESLCLSGLRSQFYSMPPGGAFPPLHPSGLHFHLPGARYSAELNHSLLAERMQMENELRQREREKEREEEREQELDRQKERQRDRQQQMVRASEGHRYLADRPPQRVPSLEDRARLGERLTPNRLDQAKESELPAFHVQKPMPLNLHSSRGSIPHSVPSLVPSHPTKHHTAPASGGVHGAVASAAMNVRASEEAWTKDSNRTGHPNQGIKDAPPALGAPPPLISPKAPQTTLWNPASFVDRRKSTPPIRPPPGLTRADRPHLSWGEMLQDGARRRPEAPERYPSAREEAGLSNKAEHDLVVLQRRHANNLHLRLCAPLSDPNAGRERQRDCALVYDEALQQHRRLLSKLDLEEQRRREAREGGYYYDLNESYDESDEEEVKAHLRRVTEQPPLKLNTSSEKVDFLRTCGLITLAHRNELLQRKRRKRRRMMRERSTSPPCTMRVKRKSPTSPAAVLTTPYTAEQMDGAPELQEKKDFLRAFNLSHVSARQRRDKEKTEELLRAIEKKIVTLDTLRYNSVPPCSSSPPAVPSSLVESSSTPPSCQSNGQIHPNSPSPSPPYLHKARHAPHDDGLRQPPLPLAPHRDKAAFEEAPRINKKLQPVHIGHLVAPLKKEHGALVNGRVRPWERFTPEAFAQHFHQAVLKSTHHKGVSNLTKADSSVPRELSPHKTPHPNHAVHHVNGHRTHSPRVGQGEQLTNADVDEGEDSSGDEEEDDNEEPPRKWKGIEAIFEAYQDYVDERSVERQVLHSQCNRLEAQNYNLSRTAEQLSLTMAELVSQRQRVREERERLHAQLEHFRRCLTLPSMHWGRGRHLNTHTPR
ncbi:genetic suppressor element 1-like isoform X1 [Hippocampus zosterae]|uniref:genetic suppressor element 1-like isoform X1 n=2 Tax=Hippocampus zosterae TaxID=109293 RepID=UPI00223D4ABF|nr:genetic suppressor element 1-like isoform X1 [Hippocampus zosterae]